MKKQEELIETSKDMGFASLEKNMFEKLKHELGIDSPALSIQKQLQKAMLDSDMYVDSMTSIQKLTSAIGFKDAYSKIEELSK